MEVGTYVGSVVVGHAVIVAAADMGEAVSAGVVVVGVIGSSGIALHGQCGGIACAKDPGGGDIETLAELIVEYNGEVVSAVVLGRQSSQ